LHLDASSMSLSAEAAGRAASATYSAVDGRLDFATAPFDAEREFTGFVSLRLWLSSSTSDADVFATLRAIDPHGNEVIFQGASEPVPLARGWLRASHRKLDGERGTPFRPFHAHDEVQKLAPGEAYALDVELWPTSFVFPRGYRLVLTLTGRDLEIEGIPGRILHTRTAGVPDFSGRTTVHTGLERASYLVLPRIPA
jgi:uncharacterized protein